MAIIGCGTTRFTSDLGEQIEAVLLHAAKNLFDAAPNVDRRDVDAVLVANAGSGYDATHDKNSRYGGGSDGGSNSNNKSHHPDGIKNKRGASHYLAPILAELAGIRPKAAQTIESLCSSGTSSIITGYAYVSSGLADLVLVCGAEVVESTGRILWWDDSRGRFKHPVFWASLYTSGYKRAHGVTDDDLATIPARAYAHARANPDALCHHNYTKHDIMRSRQLTGDLRLLDCSRPCTGGAAILLASEDVCRKYTDLPIWITGVGQKTTSAGFTKIKSLLQVESTRAACTDALSMAGLSAGKRRYNNTGSVAEGSSGASVDGIGRIDVAEIHDAFSVCEPIIFEALGMAEPGTGTALSKELYETGSRRINPRGGLIGSGHPLGATGIAQTAEIVRQLQSSAGRRQVEGRAETGLVQNMSAAATSSTVLVMRR